MSVAGRSRRALSRAALVVCALAVCAASRPLRAQGDPTPFWMPAPPSKDAPQDDDAPKKTKKKRAPPPPESSGDGAIARPAKKIKKQKPPHEPAIESSGEAPIERPARTKKPARRAPVEEQPAEAPPVEAAEPAPPPAKKKHHYEPLPPIPHIEPERPIQASPAPQYPQPYQDAAPSTPRRAAPAPTPLPPPYAAPAQPTPSPSAPPIYQRPAPAPTPPPDEPPAQPAPSYSQPSAPPIYQRPAPASRAQTVVPIDEQRAGAPSDDEPAPSSAFRRYSIEALAGFWAKSVSDGQGREWQLAFGLDAGVAIFRWLQVDVRGLYSSGTDGGAYVNATTTHLLFDGRLSGVLNLGRFALFGGAGGGVVLEQTQLFLQDVGGEPTSLSSSGVEPVGELIAGVRARPWRGLTLRLEADALLRQGNLEPVLLFGAGWSL